MILLNRNILSSTIHATEHDSSHKTGYPYGEGTIYWSKPTGIRQHLCKQFRLASHALQVCMNSTKYSLPLHYEHPILIRKGVQPPNAFYRPGFDDFSHLNPCVCTLFSTSTLYIYETLLLIIRQVGHKDSTSLAF